MNEQHPTYDIEPRRTPDGFRSRVQRAVRRIRELPENAQVFVWAALVLCALILPLLIFLFWGVLRRAFTPLTALGLVLAICVVYLTRLSRGKRRRKQEVEARYQAEASRREAEELLRRERAIERIRNGEIDPITDPTNLLLRNSELLWYQCEAWVRDRRGHTQAGQFYVTSMRISFTSPEYPAEIPIGSVNAVECQHMELQLIGKSASQSHAFVVADPEIAAAYVARSVQAFHRRVDMGFEPNAARKIPQDVKTAVWQRDGGKCVQCGAADYLEYDHIIPFAKGGANTVENIQLLCRRCNQKKGSLI